MFYTLEMPQSFLLGACEWISILYVWGDNRNKRAEIIRCRDTKFSHQGYVQLR